MPTREGPRSNDEIEATEVQLIAEDGDNLGTMSLGEAIARAEAAGLDLVEISPHADPPVCKVLDLGKFKYQAQKKAAEARKKQKTFDVKEIKMRPNIDIHDYEVKMRNMRRFFEHGDKVKVTLRFRGREMAHQELGVQLLERVKGETEEIAKVESEPRLEGRQMVMDFGDLGRGKAADLGVFADDVLVFRQIDAKGLVARDIGVDPLNVGAELFQHLVRLMGGLPQLFTLEAAHLGDIPLDYVLAHTISSATRTMFPAFGR